MNILFVHTSSFKNCGGIGRVTEINAKKFRDQGFKVNFFILKEGIQDSCFGFKQFFLLDNNYQNPSNSNYFRTILLDLKIDIIINQSGVNINSLKFIKEAQVPESKIITCYHGAMKAIYDNYSIILRGNNSKGLMSNILRYDFVCRLFQYNYKRKMKRDLKYVIDNSERFVLLSENYINEMRFYCTHLDYNKVIFINNPINYTSPKKELHEKEKRLLYVGRINFSEKRSDLLPIIWEKISKKNPDWTFDIVGDGHKLKELKQMFNSKQLNRVNFHGYTDPLPFYKLATILCMTSAIEGYGLVLTEAIENSVVPIAFDVSYGVKEALDYGNLGLLVQPFKIDSYVEELEKLIESKSYRQTFIEKACLFDAVHKNKKIEEKWLHTFEEIL